MLKKRLFAVILAFLAFMVALTLSTQGSTPINHLYVFGDSLSDTGTVFRATGGMYPPQPTYYQGRYSNGRVWVEYLGDRLSLSSTQVNNFACGGATTSSDRNSLVPGLLTQVKSFTQTHAKADSKALYVLWVGANDYLQGVSSTSGPIENITQAIASLNQVGAKNWSLD